MDKINEQVNSMLFDVFGLHPDYKVIWTEHEYIEFYEPIFPQRYINWKDVEPNIKCNMERKRLHLNEHRTRLDNGLCVVANFAVHHPSKRIYLKIFKVAGEDAYCKVYQ